MSEKEASMNYKTIQRLGFVKGLYRACYDDLCLAEKVRIPVGEYMGREGEKRYRGLVEECLLRLEEVGDMLEVVGEKMGEKKEEWNE